jgi:mono/diheme cytochrome c family protein
MSNKATTWFAAAVMALALCACESEKHSRGFDYMPDMYESPAYKSQQGQEIIISSTDKAGKKTEQARQYPMMLTPPAGTIPRDFLPYQIDAMDIESPKKLENPLQASAEVLKTGQQAYNIYCAVCHGNDGNAKDNSYVGHKFSGATIAQLNTDALLRLGDGEMYHIITHGRGNMPNYQAQLPPQTRWSVVHYVRVLNRAHLAVSKAEESVKENEAAVAKDPKNADAKAALDTAKKVLEGKIRDIDLMRAGGTGAEFIPPPAPVPEYVKPQWPE